MSNSFRALLVALTLAACCCAQEPSASIEVGGQAPNFTVANDQEEVVELRDYLAEGNVVLVFVRAHW